MIRPLSLDKGGLAYFFISDFVFHIKGENIEDQIDDIPQEAVFKKGDTELAKTVTNYSPTIEQIRLWLLAWRMSADGTKLLRDKGRKPIMNEQGADQFCSWLESITAPPVPLSRHTSNEAAVKLRLNDSTLTQTFIMNEEEWELDFNENAGMLLDIADTLGTAAINGSIGQETLSLIVKQYIVSQKIGGEESEGKKGIFPSLFKRGKNESSY